MKSYRYFFIAIVILTLSKYSVGQQASGIINLKNHNFEINEIAKIAGYWKFYHNELLSPNRLKDDLPFDSIRVPGSWNRQGDYPALGVATYQCKVLLPKNQYGLSLYIGTINSSAKIWVNGTIRTETGIVSANKKIQKPELRNITINLPENTDTLELIIQVANYSYFSGGISSTPLIGMSTALINKQQKNNGVENVFAGSLIAMFIYQIILYFLYNRGKPNLWLAVICILVALRSMVLNGGSFLLPNLFPIVPFEIWKKIEFGGVYLITAIFPLYIHHLFYSFSSKKAISFFIVAAILLVIPVVFTPQYIYGQLLDVCHVVLVLSFIYAIYTVSKAWIHKNPDAKIIFFGVLASFPFILLEILKNSFLINLNFSLEYLVELGVLVFLLFQAYILARHYANSHKSLEEINRELESEIEERTSELVVSNNIKEKLLSVISHDVRSPLYTLQSVISTYNSNILTKDEFDRFIKQIEGDLNATTGLVDNILYWTANQRKGDTINIEKVDLHKLVEENIQQLNSTARKKSIDVVHNLPEKFMLKTDRGIINFILRNLITNAIKFSHPNGKINIQLTDNDSAISLRVIDEGVGMTQEQIDQLFNSDSVQSTVGTKSEKGTGIGLNLGREYLQKMGGSIKVESIKDKGSTFEVIIPIR